MNRILLFLILLGPFFFSSCLMQKVQYVKNMTPDSLYNIKVSEALKIQPNDRLSIKIYSKDRELAAPFNTELGGYSLTLESEIVKGVNAENSFENGYLVDSDGNIDFPVFGKIKVSSLSMEEIKELISKMIKDNNYIEDPLVKVNLLNFKIMTMGTVENSVLNVTDGKITLLEAIVQAGGLNLHADATKVKVIREQNGERKLLIVNMEEYDMFNTEGYHLLQNDIVYVPQKNKLISPGTQSLWQVMGIFLGVISMTITSIALIKR
ncbi:polysaccharide biosynthesis/export family protein [Sphingobacterium rhinopitheci]|uniref:polysaccharide biosynthesis/export family protein n=1 Tax=Sphingobacterium rhinopitheci TaxID=2781960 RepID=UPI001F528D8F|nr:polysaccharide biosynthesis/export family protein [Sphingobacterium rhinopitheci]MCI0920744.1 polysaccharide biosynthesis/export family protein [Sphingobacterium rhinopitheci]